MRYFQYLTPEEEQSLFYATPQIFDNTSDKELLAYAVGAALYMPGTRACIAEDLLAQKHEGLASIVIDLEDAIGDHQIEEAEASLLLQMQRISALTSSGALPLTRLPLIFIRVRGEEQLKRLLTLLDEQIRLVTGFVFPKFTEENGENYFYALEEYNRTKPQGYPNLYGMPILESATVLYRETRMEALLGIKHILDRYHRYVLNVRIGATDFSSLFGLRRSPDMTIYDIAPIRDCISDIINVFGRMNQPYVISGPVWEYFASRERVLKPQLRQTLFEESLGGTRGRRLRMEYINTYVDGLIYEVMMDKENGMIGKTIIHPTHIKPVQSLYTVTHEEYVDAVSIIENNNGRFGVIKSDYANKMNEVKPHLNWAQRILMRSKIYGVLHEQQHFISLLPEHQHVYLSHSR